MTQVAVPTAAALAPSYAERYAAEGWAKKGPGFVRDIRNAGIAGWKASPSKAPTLPAAAPHLATEADLAPYRLAGALEMVFVDGRVSPALSHLADAPRGLLTPLSVALERPTELLEMHLGRHAGDEGAAALNAAFFTDGAVGEERGVERGGALVAGVAAEVHLKELGRPFECDGQGREEAARRVGQVREGRRDAAVHEDHLQGAGEAVRREVGLRREVRRGGRQGRGLARARLPAGDAGVADIAHEAGTLLRPALRRVALSVGRREGGGCRDGDLGHGAQAFTVS